MNPYLLKCRKYIETTLVELGFDPSSDIQLCQFDATLLENWHMINKRIKVQDKLEEKIRTLLECVWHQTPNIEPKPTKVHRGDGNKVNSPLQKSNSENSGIFSPSNTSTSHSLGKQGNAHRGSESLLDVLFERLQTIYSNAPDDAHQHTKLPRGTIIFVLI